MARFGEPTAPERGLWATSDGAILSGDVAESDDVMLVTRCAWCERYALHDAWVHGSELAAVTSGRDLVRITHSICPSCLAGLQTSGLSR